jgi:NTP pyrophosphatase (non-canonical NTP hydrolase)
MKELIADVESWAMRKGLSDPDYVPSQMLKVVEELGELAGCLAKKKSVEDTSDAFGDVMVTLIILAHQAGYDLEKCLGLAFDEIKGRTGKTVDGVFIKD